MKKPAKKMAKTATGTQPSGSNSWNIQDKALKELERGLQALHKQSYNEALGHFQAIIEGYPQEKELQDRAQGYARVCRVQVAGKDTSQRKPESYYYLGVMRANEADYDQAIEMLDRALQHDPRDERAHYVMASTRALKGERDLALKHLQEAIALNTQNRFYAMNDQDFESIRDEEPFENLVYPNEA
jgi:tetratricopeptide (TPR) repeat protein